MYNYCYTTENQSGQFSSAVHLQITLIGGFCILNLGFFLRIKLIIYIFPLGSEF